MEREDKDFRIGDKICHFRFGDDCVSATHAPGDYPVETEEGMKITKCGRIYMTDKRPSWFHGMWNEVFGVVKDVTPKRTVERFVNIWIAKDSGNVMCTATKLFKTRSEAEEHAKKWDYQSYIATAVPVQIPEELISE